GPHRAGRTRLGRERALIQVPGGEVRLVAAFWRERLAYGGLVASGFLALLASRAQSRARPLCASTSSAIRPRARSSPEPGKRCSPRYARKSACRSSTVWPRFW